MNMAEIDPQNILFFDVETSIFNKGSYADPRNFLVSYSTFSEQSGLCFKYFHDPDFISFLRSAMANASMVVGFAIKFDLHWCANHDVEVTCPVYDLQLAEFIYSGQELPYDSLDAALERYGLPLKKDVVKDYWAAGISTEHIPIEILREYNNWDVLSNKSLFEVQQGLLTDKQKRLVILEGEDLKALMAAEHAGIKFDVEKAQEKLDSYGSSLDTIELELNAFLPEGIPNGCWNWDSGDHLSALLYGGEISFEYAISEPAVYKSGDKKGQAYIRNKWFTKDILFPQRFKPLANTEVKKTKDDPSAKVRFYQTDSPTLQQLKTRDKSSKRMLELLAERSDKTKVKEMISSILNKISEKNWADNFIHAQFNQNVVITGRLSSSQPNLQNTPLEVDELLISRWNE
jgi:DNA polymerase I-like protein with 3'-5' exonuclease and polymerase domains